MKKNVIVMFNLFFTNEISTFAKFGKFQNKIYSSRGTEEEYI